ncbi:MAG: CHASE domain-containing protein [Bacillota bacterium]|nr:CHASE domain-containing protein [Bacillota bacterium]
MLPYLALAVLLVCSVFIWRFYESYSLQRDNQRFNELVNEIENDLVDKIFRYEMILQGGAGVFAASEEVTRQEWKAYCEYQQTVDLYPGVQGIGYAKIIQPEELNQHIEEFRADGFPEYDIWPGGNREIYTSIIYLEPFDERNQRAFGYDMFAEQVRRSAMERARDTGEASISGMVTLVQETEVDQQPGFLMYVPVYRKNSPLDMPDQHEEAIEGYVYAPFRMYDLLGNIFPEPIDLIDYEIYDGIEIDPESLMFASQLSREPAADRKPIFTSTEIINLYGHQWTMVFRSTPAFETISFGLFSPKGLLTLAASLLLSFIIFFYLRTLEINSNRVQEMNLALQDSEKKYRFLTENIADVIWTVDLDGRLTYMSPAIENLIGYSQQEILDIPINKYIVQEDYEALRAKLTEELAKPLEDRNLTATMPVRHITREGRIIHAEFSASWLNNDQGEIIGVQGTTRDISERKRAEDALLESYSLLRLAGETANFGGWSVDLNTNIITWSDQVAKIHDMPVGYSPSVSEGVNFYAPEWRDRITDIFTACAEKGIPYNEEMEIITARERRVWVRTTGEAVRDQNGNIIKVHGSFQDIDKQKRYEISMRESERRIITLLKNLPGMAYRCLMNRDWTMEFVSEGSFSLTGYSPADLINSKRITYAELIHPDDRQHVWDNISLAVKRGEPFTLEYRITDAAGNIKWVWERGQAVPDDENNLSVLEGFISDITRRRLAEAEIRKFNKELEQRVRERTIQLEAVNKELESFAYSVSHDLRAPLRALDGFSEALLEKYAEDMDEQGRHYLYRIQRSAMHMSHLIDDLLTLSRVTRSDFSKKEVNLSQICDKVLSDLQEGEPDREVKVNLAPGLHTRSDPHLLQIVMENLIGNAWKFSSNEPAATIEVGQTKFDGEVVYFVRDNGVGFDMTYADKLFGAFQRLHGADEFPGTGVGLATVQRIINRHGGRIWAESEVGKGATFYFTLPS